MLQITFMNHMIVSSILPGNNRASEPRIKPIERDYDYCDKANTQANPRPHNQPAQYILPNLSALIKNFIG
jgi:hypothetical protein